MSDTDKKTDEEKFNETLKRMLETPPQPKRKSDTSKTGEKQKPSGDPAKNHRSEKS